MMNKGYLNIRAVAVIVFIFIIVYYLKDFFY